MPKSPVRLWMFVKGRDPHDVLRLLGKHRMPAEYVKSTPHWARDMGDSFLVWNSYGEYGGPLGCNAKSSVKSENAVRERFTEKHRNWSPQKITRAVEEHLRSRSRAPLDARHMQNLLVNSKRMLDALVDLTETGSVHLVLEQSGGVDISEVTSLAVDSLRPEDLMNISLDRVLQFVK